MEEYSKKKHSKSYFFIFSASNAKTPIITSCKLKLQSLLKIYLPNAVKILIDPDKVSESDNGNKCVPYIDEDSSDIKPVDRRIAIVTSIYITLMILKKKLKIKLINVECDMKSTCKISHSHHQNFPRCSCAHSLHYNANGIFWTFFNLAVIVIIVRETNKYASQWISKHLPNKSHSITYM